MELITKVAWITLGVIHLMPAAVLFMPSITERLYNVPPHGDVGLLIIHRGALFLAVIAAILFAAIDPTARRVATIVVAISVIGFLLVYARAGMPDGPLRKIAIVDAIAVLPLFFVIWRAWHT